MVRAFGIESCIALVLGGCKEDGVSNFGRLADGGKVGKGRTVYGTAETEVCVATGTELGVTVGTEVHVTVGAICGTEITGVL